MTEDELAESGQAENQCPSCGVYTPDGRPAILHRSTCTIAKIDRGSFRLVEPLSPIGEDIAHAIERLT